MFRDIPETGLLDPSPALVLDGIAWSNAVDWNDLLTSKRILIASEAGSGKTFECQERQKFLWNSGEPAFLLNLTVLATSPVREMLRREEERRLDLWLTESSGIATFFLDSIDELKLSRGSFEQALKRLNKEIAGHLGRARIVVTTRPIPFDQQLLRELFPIPEVVLPLSNADSFADLAMRKTPPPNSTELPKTWRNVALMPLSDQQISQMATLRGISNPETMLAEIRQRNAEDFARRPLDLIELCADWRDYARIRSHRDQLAHDIAVKLKPRTDRDELGPLSDEKALDGASRLALATLLTRKLTIRHSAEADIAEIGEAALDPSMILTDWNEIERRTLLERALFGFASYGRVRFHHRSVIEYLAAEQLLAMLHRGASIKAVKRLLFANTGQGAKVVKPTMRPLAAWMALQSDSLFEEVRDREPEVLFNHGDPESLRPQQRHQTLAAFVMRFRKGNSRGLHVPRVQIHRFADRHLAADVNRIWGEGIENPEVRALMLGMICAGRMNDCSDVAFAVAVHGENLASERLDAVEALAALQDSRLAELTSSVEQDPVLWPNDLARSIILELFPTHMSVEQFCRVLSRIVEGARAVGSLDWQLPRIISDCDISVPSLQALRAGLTELVIHGVVWRAEWPHLVTPRPHLLPALATACARLWTHAPKSPGLPRSSAVALHFESLNLGHQKPVEELRKLVADADADVRQAVFWAHDTFLNGLRPLDDPWDRFYVASDRVLHVDSTRDRTWVLNDLADLNRPLAERAVILEAAMGMRNDGVDWAEHLTGLKQYVTDARGLICRIADRMKPTKVDNQIKRMEAAREKRKEQERRREAKNRASWIAFWREIVENPDAVFSEQRRSSTAWDLWRIMDRPDEDGDRSGWNRSLIERHFGKVVADRLRDVLSTVWRANLPTLSSERSPEEKNNYLYVWRLGLSAIVAESEDPYWAQKLSAAEAEIAARHIPVALNGFPMWIDALIEARPEAVDRILGNELSVELDELAAPNRHAMMLQCIDYAALPVAGLFVPRLRAWIRSTRGTSRADEDASAATNRLNRVVRILLKRGDSEIVEDIKAIAVERLAVESEGPFAHLWLSVLTKLDPVAGVDTLSRLLEKTDVSPTGAGVEWFANLYGDRHGEYLVSLRHPEFTPPLLLKLVRLAYRHIDPSSDRQHDGPYRPDIRDEGEQGRNAVLDALLRTSGHEGWAAKIEMANDPIFAHFRDRTLSIALESAAEEVDVAVHPEKAIVSLTRHGETGPVVTEEMFVLMLDRLDDIDDLLLRDESPRSLWATIEQETIMRRALARELNGAANHAYTVDQEAVTAEEKETDIRLRSTASKEEAVIELKIGEKDRSANDLRVALREQLVAKYMAPDNRRSGCFLVTVKGGRRWRHPDNNLEIGLDGLIAMLNEEASKIEGEIGGGLRLSAHGLDLRPRCESEITADQAPRKARGRKKR